MEDYKSRGRIKQGKKHKKYQSVQMKNGAIPKKYRVNHPNSPRQGGRYTLPRQINRVCNMDQIQYKALDFCLTGTPSKKTMAPNYREHYEVRTRMNTQNNYTFSYIDEKLNDNLEKKKIQAAKKAMKESKCIRLPKIYDNLWLSDIYFKNAYNNLTDIVYEFDTIISISDKSSHQNNKNNKNNKNNISLQFDDKKVVWKELGILVNKFNEIMINEIENNRNILVQCKAGTNRSVFLIISLAMKLHKQGVGDIKKAKNSQKKNAYSWIDYINEIKSINGFKSWDTMTNQYFLRYLCFK